MESANNTTCELSEDVCDDKCLNKIWGFWIEGVATSVISVFGILGKSISLMIMINHNQDEPLNCGDEKHDKSSPLLGFIISVNG